MASRQSRAEQRKGYDQPTRVSLLEQDADIHEAIVGEVNAKLDKIYVWLVTGAISFAGMAMLLAVNIVRGV